MRRVPPVYSQTSLRECVRALFAESGAAEIRRAAAEALSARTGQAYVELTASGTQALQLALTRSVTTSRPAICALPAYACPDLGTAALGAGFRIVLYDLVPETLSPDLPSLVRCLDAGATHVVVAHFFGIVVDIDAVSQLATPYSAVVIEDAAQAAGGSLRGIAAGASGAWSVMSFGRGKGLNAGGGGALLTSVSGAGDSIAADLRASTAALSARQALVAIVTDVLSHPSSFGAASQLPFLHVGETLYSAPHAPTAMSLAGCRLLLDALASEPGQLAARRASAARWEEALAEFSALRRIEPTAGSAPGWLRVPLLTVDGKMASALARLLVSFGVARPYPRILLDYSELRSSIIETQEPLAGARRLADSLITLPTHALVEPSDFERVVKILAHSLDRSC